jgi:hypothetical protein
MSDHDDDPDLSMRLSASGLGLLAGLAFGLVFGFVAGGAGGPPVEWFVFSGLVSGTVTGFLWPAAGLGLAQAFMHFLAGLLTVAAERVVHDPGNDADWLKAMLWLGIIFGLLVMFGFLLW